MMQSFRSRLIKGSVAANLKRSFYFRSVKSIQSVLQPVHVLPHCQKGAVDRLCYSTSVPLSKIYTINSDLSDEEVKKIIEDEEKRMEEEEKEKFIHDSDSDWKAGERKRKLVVSRHIDEFEYEMFPERFPERRWTLRDKRCGALAIKVGMMPIWDDWGERHPCTILYMDKNIVMGHKTMDKHGYNAIQIAAGERKAKNVNKTTMGQYKEIIESYNTNKKNDDNLDESGTVLDSQQYSEKKTLPSAPYLVREFRITDPDYFIPVNSEIHARHFVPGQNVDVAGISKGKGFQGAMKLHNFGGMPASHGTSLSHRALGSTGQCQDPGKVFKGKKMAGRMGTNRVTVQNKRVVKIDRGRNLIFVKGAIPGNKGAFVEIRDAVKKPLWNTKMVLGEPDRPPLPTFDFDAKIDGSGQSQLEEIMPLLEEDPLDPDYGDSQTTLNFEK